MDIPQDFVKDSKLEIHECLQSSELLALMSLIESTV